MAEKVWYGYGSALYAGIWDWDTDSFVKNLDNAGATDEGGGLVGIPITGHEYVAGDTITLAGTTNYDGAHVLHSSTTTDKIVITASFVSETFAGTETATSAVTTSNWKDTDGANTTRPAASDTVYFDHRAYANTGDNRYQDVTAGPATEVDVTFLWVKSTYSGYIGGSTEYITMGAATILFEGTGELWFSLSAGAAADETCGHLRANGAGVINIKSELNDASWRCKYTEIFALSGTLNLADDTAFGEITIAGESAIVNIGAGCWDKKGGFQNDFYIYKGVCYCDSLLGAFYQVDGTFHWGTDGIAAAAGLDCEVMLRFGGTFNWNVNDSTVSIIKENVQYGGLFDVSKAINVGNKKQIGSGSAEKWELYGGTMNLDDGLDGVTLGSGSAVLKYGGTLITPIGEDVQF